MYTIVTISVVKAGKLVNLNKLTGLQNSIYLYIYCLGNVTELKLQIHFRLTLVYRSLSINQLVFSFLTKDCEITGRKMAGVTEGLAEVSGERWCWLCGTRGDWRLSQRSIFSSQVTIIYLNQIKVIQYFWRPMSTVLYYFLRICG